MTEAPGPSHGGRDRIRSHYLAFAQNEARDRSPTYSALAHAVAERTPLQDFLLTLPPHKRQANLFLAAVRWVTGVPGSADELERVVRDHAASIREVMRTRSTQTNEPGRCAALLPVLAQLQGPLALVEVGASGGLCLLPDHYGYDYDGQVLLPDGAGPDSTPVFPCSTNDPRRVPRELPEVVWRRGLDLHPIDIRDPDQSTWLETLVWPEQTGRADRLQQALTVARRSPPSVREGDLATDLAALVEDAPRGATVVVFHTAVLAYVADQGARDRFAESVGAMDVVWIANEAPTVFPWITAKATPPPPRGRFLLSKDGEPLAWTAPHGQSLEWITYV